MSASLVILAAGLGSRFKDGIKQLTPVGAKGELLMEYSVYDAVNAGFDEIIFILRRDIEQQFRELIGDRISKKVKVSYCFQDMNDLPEGFSVPEGRKKPWGTVHAVLAAAELINQPFLIINADDYYGKDAYKSIFEFITAPDRRSGEQCMGGFILKNTLSTTGTVTRGICSADENHRLTSVTETYRTSRHEDGIIRGEQNGTVTEVSEDSIASMNMWGCGAEMIPMLKECFEEFLEKARKENILDTAEYALPLAADKLIKNGSISVEVLKTHDRWYGMTHKEDCPEIIAAFADMVSKGEYPSPLFG
ncbi:MAG: NDP-sugar synthase [Huintestinicola sp.]